MVDTPAPTTHLPNLREREAIDLTSHGAPHPDQGRHAARRPVVAPAAPVPEAAHAPRRAAGTGLTTAGSKLVLLLPSGGHDATQLWPQAIFRTTEVLPRLHAVLVRASSARLGSPAGPVDSDRHSEHNVRWGADCRTHPVRKDEASQGKGGTYGVDLTGPLDQPSCAFRRQLVDQGRVPAPLQRPVLSRTVRDSLPPQNCLWRSLKHTRKVARDNTVKYQSGPAIARDGPGQATPVRLETG